MKNLICTALLILSITAWGQNYDEIANLKTGDYVDESPSLIGLWGVDLVTVGDEQLTPTAKWFEFSADGTQTAGNGWVQNGKGLWRYDAAASTLLTLDESGQTDEYGAFKITIEQASMTWERIEDGMTVKVNLTRIDKKPLAPWDKITGRWEAYRNEIHHLNSNQIDFSDLEPYSFYFGWDRRYRKFDASGKRVETGIWHIEPHSPWLWLIPDDGSEKRGQEILFNEKEMTLISKEGQLKDKTFFRRD